MTRKSTPKGGGDGGGHEAEEVPVTSKGSTTKSDTTTGGRTSGNSNSGAALGALDNLYLKGGVADILAHQGWAPRTQLAFFIFAFINFFSALFTNIGDCDETFNYWEPTHYILYGVGYQTWEYAPQYALRSYSYLALHAIPGGLASLFVSDKVVIFYSIRVAIGMFSAVCETVFYRGVRKRFGKGIAFHTFLVLILAPGMFAAVTSYLPSSFAMNALMLSWGAWYTNNHRAAVLWAAFGTILSCWPFVLLISLPLALDSIRTKGFLRVLSWGVLALLLFLVPCTAIDIYFYRKPVIPLLNLFWYNVAGPTGGSTLYGVEPWYFYVLNGFLNFNYMFFFAVLSLPLLFIAPYCNRLIQVEAGIPPPQSSIWMYLSPMYIWLTFMICLPHKEERFLFPIYPLFCLGGAIGLSYLLRGPGKVLLSIVVSKRKNYTRALLIFTTILVALFALLSMSRISSLIINYSAPTLVYKHLSQYELKGGHIHNYPVPGPINICVGKEWYRFPSHFFIPGKRFHYHFLKSAFTGELPQLYLPWEDGGTWIERENFNDRNEEEPSRYVSPDTCHYVVDLDLPDQVEEKYARLNPWQKVYFHDFLNAKQSHPLFRAFYVPWVSEALTQRNRYWLLKNNQLIFHQSPDGKYVRVLPHDHAELPHIEHPQVRALQVIEEHEKRRKEEEARKRKQELGLTEEELAELELLEEERRTHH